MIAAELRESMSTPFDLAPLTPGFGAVVSGFDLKTLSQACSRQAFLECLCHHKVLVFRDQDLSATQFSDIGRFCGELENHVREEYCLPEEPAIYVISNVVENGKPVGNPKDGFGWHTDQSYLPLPTAYTLLYGIETPAEGSDTLFTDTARAYEGLDPATRNRIDELRATHSYTHMRLNNTDYIRDNDAAVRPSDELLARVPDVVHPLVRTHPISGAKSLYLGGGCIASIDGLSQTELRSLLDALFAASLDGAYRLAHKWQPRDVVIWDNRTTMHTATDYDRERFRRLIWRLSVRGEVPH